MTKSLVSFAAITAVFSSACLIAGLSGGSSGIKADNPLGASPISARSRSDVFAQGEKDCSFWPLEDEIEVSATDSQICVTRTVLKAAPTPTWSGPPTMNRMEFVKILSDSKETGSSLQITKGRESKVGMCRGNSVWKFEYKGCEPNEGTLTADSFWLSAGDKRWVFKEEPAAPGGDPAPASETSAAN